LQKAGGAVSDSGEGISIAGWCIRVKNLPITSNFHTTSMNPMNDPMNRRRFPAYPAEQDVK
jgi:hypothetical protein